jgi:threonine/homoserine/homoserine lactone efflux protein
MRGVDLIAFLGVCLAVICSPGQDTALTIRNTLTGGLRGGTLTALGVSTGQAVWTVAASAGVAAVIVASEPAFLALKLAGAAYLIGLGLLSLRDALRPRRGERAHGSVPRPTRRSGRAYRQGLVSNLGNPKMAVFFTSLLPQFVSDGGGAFAAMTALGLLFCVLTLAWLLLYAAAVARFRDLLSRPRVRRALDAVTGTALVGLGARLAAQQRPG